MSMEVHCQVRGNLKPDPEHDPVVAVFYCIHNDVPKDSRLPREVTGMIIISADEHAVSGELNAHKEQKESLNLMEGRNILCDHHVLGQQGQDVLHADQGSKECQTCVCLVRDCRENEVGSKSTNGSKPSGATKSCWFLSKQQFLASHGLSDIDTIVVDMEQTLFKKLAEVVMRWNPDIVIGYEIELLSWGYIIQRAEHLKVPLHNQLSRIHFENCADKMHSTNESAASRNVDGEIMLPGRVVLNAWRIFRAEIALNVYTFENVYYHVLHQRVPLYTFATLSEWLSKKAKNRWRVIDHYVTRVRGTLQLLERLNVIGRTSELARVFGIQFYEVLSRGSQFRVESMLMRSIKPLNYVAVSPSVQQRAMSRAPEWIPLILEPESRLYTHPVIVLDFQSLYPSIVIAYNYCYSTCLGRMEHLGRNDVFGFGCTNLHVPPPVLKMLEKDITISPCGVAFVKSNVRRGILPQMLEEILTTRIMVKSSMKRYKNDKALNRLLDARQLGLKLIANVTYGYTAANFSGRMPCVEVADSIVSKGRETLENAIRFVENSKKWKAHVVYGDTDSMFVLLPGQTKEEAFRIGQEIAEEVTAMNPKPVKLKFEKVYLPCLLQTKKRYVGFKFESPDQIEPVYDAKGIETVRRDSCPAVSKIVEKSLRILFSGSSVQVAKEYVQKQFQKFLTGKVSIQDCIFAKEYRGMGGYKPGACVPSLEISRRMLASDPLSEPRIGERVPYVIVYGPPGLPLIRLVHQPQDLLADSGLRINGHYYIRNVIVPPLNRIFSLIGVNVMNWYSEVPRTKVALGTAEPSLLKRSTISQYFSSRCCPVCGDSAFQGVCNLCQQDPQKTAVLLNELVRKWERMSVHIKQICQSCTGIHDGQDLCVSLVCPIRYCHSQVAVDISRTHQFRQIQARLLEF